jgi:hypothetical protein
MPIVFGPTDGPRNLPARVERLRYTGERTALHVTARIDGDRLARLLPQGFWFDGEPRLSVVASELRNLGWLAGRGYKLVMVTIPAVHDGGSGPLPGDFVVVVWENLTEPILTGREELGYPKVFGDIDGPLRIGDAYRCGAGWQGHRFFEMELADLGSEVAAPAPRPRLVKRYVPNPGPGPDVEQVLAIGSGLPGARRAAPDGRLPEITVRTCRAGTGRFAFHPARWEEMPTQHHIVKALAGLPLLDFEESLLVESTGQDDLSDVRELGATEPRAAAVAR